MSPAPLSPRILKLIQTTPHAYVKTTGGHFVYPGANLGRYVVTHKAVWAVFVQMARLGWSEEDVVLHLIEPVNDRGDLQPLFQDYISAYTGPHNVFEVSERDQRRARHDGKERAINFICAEYARAQTQIARDRAPLFAMAQLEFQGWGKQELARLAVLRANLVLAARYGNPYNAGEEQLAALSQVSRKTIRAVQRWLGQVKIVSRLARGNVYQGRVSRWRFNLSWTESWSDLPNSRVEDLELIDCKALEILCENWVNHSSGLQPELLPFEHPELSLTPVHPIFARLGLLPWFIYERLGERTELPPWLARVARERLVPYGLAKQYRDGWSTIPQDLDVLDAALAAKAASRR